MTAGDLVVVLAAVLLSVGFAALVVVLLRVLDAVRDLRREVVELREQTRPLLADLRESADEAREDLARFDRVLGSAEAIGDAVGGTVARSAFSSPAIKAAGAARGARRTWSRLRHRPVEVGRRREADVIDVRRRAAALPAADRRGRRRA